MSDRRLGSHQQPRPLVAPTLRISGGEEPFAKRTKLPADATSDRSGKRSGRRRLPRSVTGGDDHHENDAAAVAPGIDSDGWQPRLSGRKGRHSGSRTGSAGKTGGRVRLLEKKRRGGVLFHPPLVIDVIEAFGATVAGWVGGRWQEEKSEETVAV